MKSSSMIALAAVIALALPGAANAASSFDSGRTVFGDDTFVVEQALAERGVHAERVEEWGDQVRAFVAQPDGKIAMQYFDRYTLQAVN